VPTSQREAPAWLIVNMSRELDARGDSGLAEDVAEVEVDRPRAEEQLRRDLAVGQPLGDETGDLDFLRGELVERARVAPP
jgi:hypothetical protein